MGGFVYESLGNYVQIMKSLLAPDFRYLLNVTQYTPDEFFSGPPRNVPRELIEQFFVKIFRHFPNVINVFINFNLSLLVFLGWPAL
ncbi:putative Thiopurine S-methyltransferase (TPMT)-containing protein [Homarus americanus]|uniref:Putative Thiopurine S-methyltransferase (TPMT)-containing protein n=1 Tax=Homarus americanus TaxID=6706 RepID=A0A8J5MUH6_HOMAM|nr:putative Thiopurine S-methyltransferase (TPMT)-containing protein [Homarus americanus]